MTALAFGLSIVAMVHGINYYDTVWGLSCGSGGTVSCRGGGAASAGFEVGCDNGELGRSICRGRA